MKQLLVKPEKCLGCRTCELVCSFGHNGEFDPTQSNVTVMEYESAGVSIPALCMQCEDAACVKVCPMKALSRDDNGAVVVAQDRCIACRTCISACPLGNIAFSSKTRKIFKCDLCGGDPKCAKFCPSGALLFSEPEEGIGRREAIAAQFSEVFAG